MEIKKIIFYLMMIPFIAEARIDDFIWLKCLITKHPGNALHIIKFHYFLYEQRDPTEKTEIVMRKQL